MLPVDALDRVHEEDQAAYQGHRAGQVQAPRGQLPVPDIPVIKAFDMP